MPPTQVTNVFGGQRASYVALAAISTLAIALLSSIWESDVSGSIALLGLLAVYLASNELLTLVGGADGPFRSKLAKSGWARRCTLQSASVSMPMQFGGGVSPTPQPRQPPRCGAGRGSQHQCQQQLLLQGRGGGGAAAGAGCPPPVPPCATPPAAISPQYVVFTPASIVVDIIRLSVVHVTGRGWLVFFQILGMVCKVRRRRPRVPAGSPGPRHPSTACRSRAQQLAGRTVRRPEQGACSCQHPT
jgi:hypothetical protein